MPANTAAPWSIPYPLGTDRVMDGDNAMQAIAERMNVLLNQNIKQAPIPQQNVTPVNGWAGNVAWFMRNGIAQVWIAVSKAGTWPTGDLVAYLPSTIFPYLGLYTQAVAITTSAPVPISISTNGTLAVAGAIGGGGGIYGYYCYQVGNTNP